MSSWLSESCAKLFPVENPFHRGKGHKSKVVEPRGEGLLDPQAK